MLADQNQNQIREDRMNPAACRKLICAVINEQFSIATMQQTGWRITDSDIGQARRWFRSKDFAMYCDLLGLDPHFVRRGVENRIAILDAAAAADRGDV